VPIWIGTSVDLPAEWVPIWVGIRTQYLIIQNLTAEPCGLWSVAPVWTFVSRSE